MNKSKILSNILDALNSGEQNDATKIINSLSNLDGKKLFTLDTSRFDNENYQFNDDLNPTPEKITEATKIFEEFIVENNVTEELKSNAYIDELLDYMSMFTDNNDPYPFLFFNETFDCDCIKYDTLLRDRYDKIINHPMYNDKLMIFERWKDVITSMNVESKLKYYIANQLECVEYSLIVYELKYNVIIDRKRCYLVLIPILNEMHSVFDAFDFIKKYYTAALKYSIMNNDFAPLFIEQYTRDYRIKNERKLF